MHDCNQIRNQIYINSPGEVQGDVEHTEAAPHLIQKRSWRIKCGDWNEPQTTDTEASQTNALLYVVRQAGKNISTYSHTTPSLPGSSTLESLVFICEKSHFCIIQFFLVHVSHLQLFFFLSSPVLSLSLHAMKPSIRKEAALSGVAH